MFAEPQKEHQWLQQLVGNWTQESECSMGPDQPPMKMSGKDSTRALGGLWVISDWTATAPDSTGCDSIMTLGYDPARQRFVGTFTASVMTHLWLYEGQLDAAGKVLTLDTEGPNFDGSGAMAKYQDIIEIVSPDERLLRSRTQDKDGNWTEFMRATFRRVK